MKYDVLPLNQVIPHEYRLCSVGIAVAITW